MEISEEQKRAINALKQIDDFDDLCETCYYIDTERKTKYGCVGCREEAKDIVLNLIEKLQKENEELKNQEATARRINELLVQRYSNSIPVQKIKDKIEYLKDYIEENSDEQGYWVNINPDVVYGQIEILEEILKLESE